MKKIIKLTESDLYRIIKRVINEQEQDITSEDFDYYFDKVNDSSTIEQPVFIQTETQNVYYREEDKLKKSYYLIPKKEDIGFDNQNIPNQSLIDGNKLCQKFYDKATKVIEDVPYTKEALPIDIVFIDEDNVPKRGKIMISDKTGTIIKITQIAKKI